AQIDAGGGQIGLDGISDASPGGESDGAGGGGDSAALADGSPGGIAHARVSTDRSNGGDRGVGAGESDVRIGAGEGGVVGQCIVGGEGDRAGGIDSAGYIPRESIAGGKGDGSGGGDGAAAGESGGGIK